MSEFKIGQRAWSVELGWGVIENTSSVDYPFRLFGDSGRHTLYTRDGKVFVEHLRPTLFHDEPKDWPNPPPPPPPQTLKRPDWLLTKWNWIARDDDDSIYVFENEPSICEKFSMWDEPENGDNCEVQTELLDLSFIPANPNNDWKQAKWKLV